MKVLLFTVCLLALLSVVNVKTLVAESTQDQEKLERPSMTLSGIKYFYRWSKEDQHEFTPAGQENLDHWTDMVTINYYRSVTDGEGLAAIANTVLGTYKSNRGIIVKTDSVPRRPEKPAEYLIVVLFPTPDFIEAAFTRFKIVRGIGTSTVYSHREYGEKIGDRMSAWLEKNGPATEKALMALEELPLCGTAKDPNG